MGRGVGHPRGAVAVGPAGRVCDGKAAEFPETPHRYCANHFLRDVAKPVREADSHAKVQMRRKVRGLRSVEQAVLKKQRESQEAATVANPPVDDAADQVVLDYCAAVRGILNDDQGGPLHPPGLRMAEALTDVRESLQKNLDAKKGGAARSNYANYRAASRRGCKQWPRSRRRSRSTSKR